VSATSRPGHGAAPREALSATLEVVVGSGDARFAVSAELSLARGVLVLFGPSGAGKSLTLQALAGLVRPRRGAVRVCGEVLFDSERGISVAPHKRRLGYVPQHHALFPFLTVEQNAAFGLSWSERRRKSREIAALLEELGVAHLARARPASLSGGERQRVALARALAVSPRLLLLDEPFSSIDEDGRAALRRTLREALERRDTPAVFVTHDPEEALSIGDAAVLFERGRTTRSGAPGALLPVGRPVVVAGVPAGAPRPLGDGRAAMALTEAVIEGPEELFGGAGEGPIRLALRTEKNALEE
jgi:molybdate transport system ATP-binding protein